MVAAFSTSATRRCILRIRSDAKHQTLRVTKNHENAAGCNACHMGSERGGDAASRNPSGSTSPVVADNGRTRIFVEFRDAERFVSDDAGCLKGETTRARRGDGRNRNGNQSFRHLKVHSPVESRLARVVSAAKQPPASPVFVFRPKARTAWAESHDRFWTRPEMVLSSVSRAP